MLKIEKISSNITVKEEATSQYKSRYILEPLYRGYGHTLGNSLRRIFLSSIPGTAIKGVKIEGVVSEFSTISGVKENVVDIILNIKEIVIKAKDSGEKTAKLSVKGPQVVTGKDIKVNSSFEIVNKDHIIATITKAVNLDIEFIIDTGTGFVNSDDIEKSSWPADFLPIDALYSPIVNVSYTVEDTMVGRITNFDRLTLDIETNGSVETNEVMSYAVELLQIHLAPLKAIGNRMEYLRDITSEDELSDNDDYENKLPDIKIEHLDLSVRSFNCLKKNGIENLKSLAKLKIEDLLEIKNLGKGSLNEILSKLKEYGVSIEKND